MNNYLQINNLNVSFNTFKGKKEVLKIDELHIGKGETLGVVGESESGKSVLAMTILQILPIPPGEIENGEIFLAGEELLSKSERKMKKIRGRKISMIFQDPMSTLNPVFTVGRQIINVLRYNRGMSRKEAKKEAIDMIEVVQLPDPESIMDKYPHELSGGQRQRIIIALALACGAELLIADEPTRNLDVTIQANILKLIADLKEDFDVTVLFLTNNMSLISIMCDEVAIIYKGQIIEYGYTRQIIDTPAHPYTFTLLDAMPSQNKEEIDLSKIKSDEIKEESFKGCPYYNRCFKREEKCKNSNPGLEAFKNDHLVSCYFPVKGGEEVE